MAEQKNGLKEVFETLLAYRDGEGKAHTQQSMADKLNADQVPSLSGKPWSKYSVRRVLKSLGLQSGQEEQPESAPPPKKAAPAKRPSVTRAPARSRPAGKKQATAAPVLKESSPLMQWSYFESIRDLFDELYKEGISNSALAEELNARGVKTVDGQAWSDASVRGALKVLQPSGGVTQEVQDEIRERIRQGFYDTPEEKFVAVPVKQGKKGKKEKKGKSDEEPKASKAKKKGKGKKK